MSKTKKSRIQFNIERCKGCGLCVLFCPKGHLRMSEELNSQGSPYAEIIDPAACNACGICFRMCPDVAIEITEQAEESGSQDNASDGQSSGK